MRSAGENFLTIKPRSVKSPAVISEDGVWHCNVDLQKRNTCVDNPFLSLCMTLFLPSLFLIPPYRPLPPGQPGHDIWCAIFTPPRLVVPKLHAGLPLYSSCIPCLTWSTQDTISPSLVWRHLGEHMRWWSLVHPSDRTA